MIARKIIKLRKAVGWSQSELARQANITSAAISQLEKGGREPSLSVLRKIAKAFHVPITEITGDSPINIFFTKERMFFVRFEVINKLNDTDQRLILEIAKRLIK